MLIETVNLRPRLKEVQSMDLGKLGIKNGMPSCQGMF